MLTISKMSTGEEVELFQLFSEITRTIPYYNDLAKEEEIEAYNPTSLLSKIDAFPSSILTFKVDNKIIGYCFSHLDCYTLWIDWFGVHKDFRRKGYARSLLINLETIAKDNKCHKIWCDSRSNNIQSISLFKSLGYEIITEIKNHWYKQDFVLLQKEI